MVEIQWKEWRCELEVLFNQGKRIYKLSLKEIPEMYNDSILDRKYFTLDFETPFL